MFTLSKDRSPGTLEPHPGEMYYVFFLTIEDPYGPVRDHPEAVEAFTGAQVGHWTVHIHWHSS